jgi:hypothetical protein
LALLTPVCLILALIVLGDLNRARADKVKTSRSTVVVAFTGSVVQVDSNNQPIANPPPLPYEHVYLNVVSVRLNPSTNAVATDGEGGWQTIPVPAGVGNSTTSGFFETGLNFGGNFGNGGNSVGLGEGRSELQIDVAQLSQQPLVFNAGQIKANTYNQVELVLDSSSFRVTIDGKKNIASNAGNVVPLCSSLQPAGEGCIIYPVTIFNPSATISITKTPINLSKKGFNTLVINIQVNVQAAPPVSGAPILIQPEISLVQNLGTSQSGLPLNQELASVGGQITNYADNSSTIVTAEYAGTNDIVEQYYVQSSGTTANPAGSYALFLPAAPGGTSYDIYVSGINRALAVKSGFIALPGVGTTLNFDTPTQNTVTLAGKLTDACTSNPTLPVQAATVQLLVPDPAISPAPDCTGGPAPGCVSVATASSDETGTYPIPGNDKLPAPFNNIPTSSTAADQLYTMLITASGFDRTVEAVASNGDDNLNCPQGTGGPNNCNFTLDHGYLDGSVGLSSASTGFLSATVMAEDTGTGNIENLAQAIVQRSQSSADFSMPVPDNVGNFDLFATVQDDFEGQPQIQSMHVPQANTGHSIPVVADVEAPAACATVSAGELGSVTCLGHGSLEGSLNNPTSATTVALEEDGVQVITGVVGPFGTDNSGGYAICAPPGDYTLQRFDNGVPGESTPVALNDPTIVPTPAPSGSTVPTPCPGICDKGQGGDCLVCNETAGPSL